MMQMMEWTREEVRTPQMLAWDDTVREEIGSRMHDNYIAIPADATVREAMSQLVREAADKDHIATLYLVDADGVFQGAMDLQRLIMAREGTPLSEIAVSPYPFLYAHITIEDALPFLGAHTGEDVPILDTARRLLGVVTAADYATLLAESLTEDYAKLAGLAAEEDLAEPIQESVQKRLPWLCILLVLGLGVSAVVGLFTSLVARLPVILCFQSLILDMAGNVGTQSLAVAIRVLMDDGLTGRQKTMLVWKEMRVGLWNGGLLGIMSCVAVGLYLLCLGDAPAVAFAVSGCLGLSMLVAMVVSSLSGTLIPLFFQRMGIDPAVASGPLITTVNDLVAVVTYYGLSWLFLLTLLGLG